MQQRQTPSRRRLCCGKPVAGLLKKIDASPHKKKAPHACDANWQVHGARRISRTGGGATKTLPSGKPYAVVANPPSTGITAPQTKPLARDARYNAIPAISSGAPMRFIGASSTTWREPCSSIASVIFDGK
jgi:hypothetical protein